MAFCVAVAVAVAACAPSSVPGPAAAALPFVAAPVAGGPAELAVPSPATATGAELQPVLVVDDPALLTPLGQGQLAFARVALTNASQSLHTLAELATDADVALVVTALRGDIEAAGRKDPKSGVGLRYSHRRFDPAWLASPASRLELVGVINRPDRQAFATAHCGETRLLYRLRYGEFLLPLTVNTVFWQDADPNQTCADVARRWRERPQLADVLTHAVFGRVQRNNLKSVEVNAQTVRWPSSVRGDLGGHAEYSLRVFQPGPDGQLRAGPLENTPDVQRLSKNPKLRADLLAWLQDPAQLRAIDRGVAVLPERFLATAAQSVTPHGLARRANRPWRQLFAPQELPELPLAALPRLQTPAGLLRRLDTMTCQGCHQSRSVAGFHFVGRQPVGTPDGLHIATSPHLAGQLSFRASAARCSRPSCSVSTGHVVPRVGGAVAG